MLPNGCCASLVCRLPRQRVHDHSGSRLVIPFLVLFGILASTGVAMTGAANHGNGFRASDLVRFMPIPHSYLLTCLLLAAPSTFLPVYTAVDCNGLASPTI